MSEHTPELLPCPFCGVEQGDNDEGESLLWVEEAGVRSRVCCNQCGSRSGFRLSKDRAIKAWNTRAPDPIRAALRDCVEALEAAQSYVESSGWTRHRADEIAQIEAAITNARKALEE